MPTALPTSGKEPPLAASRTYSLSALKGKPVVDRVSFAKIHEPLQVPDLLGLQTDSFGWLIGSEAWARKSPGEQSGLEEIFEEISPIENAAQTMGLVLSTPHLEDPKYSIAECRERDLTYAAPLYVTAEFQNYETGEIKSQTTFIGDFPLMTERGTFIINGTERVVVSQLVRSPGVYFERVADKTSDKDVFSTKVIPSRGAWLEFEIDKRDAVGVRVDRKRKQSVTVFLKALGMAESEIREIFADFPALIETLEKDTVHTQEEALTDLYRKLRPGEPPTAEAGRTLLNNFYFNTKRYDTAKVGRFKINKKLGLDPSGDSRQLGISDITAVLRYLLALHAGQAEVVCAEGAASVAVETDDIDHFGNRRIRAVGELIQNQVRTGLSRLDRMVRERMTTQEAEAITPSSLINIRPIVAAIKEFFGTSQLSQFMDQNNPLAGLTHKRRLSALGPGGLSRDRAGMEVRDVHPSHYGRMCPIETPEGPNIGLIGSLASFARINSFGFIETPYRRVVDGVATDEIVYLQADDEDRAVIAQAEAPLDAGGRFLDEEALCRMPGGEPALVPVKEIDYMDVSARQMCSVGTAMIPFLEHDDANRALMGANMQRQAVPLIRPVAPYVGTGMEMRAAVDAGDVTAASAPGVVLEVDADSVVVEQDNGRHVTYKMTKFERSNPGNCINQKVVVKPGDRLEAGTLIADGPATEGGELALGQNLLVAFMTWNGFNYEDAIILSERCVKDDLLTSIHIEEHEVDARDTKLGPEEITRDIPNVSDEMLSHYTEINKKYWKLLECGKMEKERILVERFEEFFAKEGIRTDEVKEFNKEYQHDLGDTIVFNDNALEIIKAQKKNCKIIIVTNGTAIAQNKKLERSGLDKIADNIFISELVGFEKPNIHFFEKVIAEAGIEDVSQAVIIGDSLTSDIQGGCNSGIDTCWYNPKGEINDTNLIPTYTIKNLHELETII